MGQLRQETILLEGELFAEARESVRLSFIGYRKGILTGLCVQTTYPSP